MEFLQTCSSNWFCSPSSSHLFVLLFIFGIILSTMVQDSLQFEPKKLKLKKALAIGGLMAAKSMMPMMLPAMVGMADGQIMFDKMAFMGDMLKEKMNMLNGLLGAKFNMFGSKAAMMSDVIQTQTSPENMQQMADKLNQFMQGWAALKGAKQAKIQTLMTLAQAKGQMMQQLAHAFAQFAPPPVAEPIDPHHQKAPDHHYQPVPEYGAPTPHGPNFSHENNHIGGGWGGESGGEGPGPAPPGPPIGPGSIQHGPGQIDHGPGPIEHGPGPVVPISPPFQGLPLPVGGHQQIPQPYFPHHQAHPHQDQIYYNHKRSAAKAIRHNNINHLGGGW